MIGVDYGHGLVNIDIANGIRYGVIALTGYMSEELEYDFPFRCPYCGSDSLVQSRSRDWDYFCQSCRTPHESMDCYGDEEVGFHYDKEGYVLVDCLDTNVMVIRSPYFTFAPYCSPCVPGAGDLDNSVYNPNDGVKTYCLGPEWFEDGVAPYLIFKVVN